MRLLKASVIVMGVLIVIGTVVLVIGIINQSGRSGRTDAQAPVADIAKALRLPLGLPAGTTLDQVTPGARGVVLRVTVPGEGPVVYVVPWGGRGRVVRITLGTEMPPPAAKPVPTKP